MQEQRMNKIVATLGPSIYQKGMLKKVDKYIDIYRINLSHADLNKTRDLIKTIREINSKKVFFLDTKGPEIRTTNEDIIVEKGDTIKVFSKQKQGFVSLAYEYFKNITVGAEISFNDRAVEGIINSNNGEYLEVEITSGGKIGFNKTVNFVGYEIELDFLTEKDKKDIEFMVEKDIAMIAASFIKNHKDVIRLRKYINDNFNNYNPKIISKIETISAVNDIENIIKHSDGIMIARGDLGGVMDLVEMPKIQKDITKLCNLYGKPIILATQVMASMTEKSVPTRAELDEIAYNIQNGVDALMLSDETAIGKFPLETVSILSKAIIRYQDDVKELKYEWNDIKQYVEDKNQIKDYLLYNAKKVTYKLGIKLIIVHTLKGYTPARISSLKPGVPIFTFTDCDKVYRYCNLMAGVDAHKIGDKNITHEELKKIAAETIQNEFKGYIKGDDKILLMNSTGNKEENMVNSMEILEFKDL